MGADELFAAADQLLKRRLSTCGRTTDNFTPYFEQNFYFVQKYVANITALPCGANSCRQLRSCRQLYFPIIPVSEKPDAERHRYSGPESAPVSIAPEAAQRVLPEPDIF